MSITAVVSYLMRCAQNVNSIHAKKNAQQQNEHYQVSLYHREVMSEGRMIRGI
jgi:hypothetical protein